MQSISQNNIPCLSVSSIKFSFHTSFDIYRYASKRRIYLLVVFLFLWLDTREGTFICVSYERGIL